MVNVTFNNILNIVEVSFIGGETGVTRENHRSVASHLKIISHNVVSSTHRLSGIRTHNVSGNRN